MSSKFSFKQDKSNTFRDEKARNRSIRETKLIHKFLPLSLSLASSLKLLQFLKPSPCIAVTFSVSKFTTAMALFS